MGGLNLKFELSCQAGLVDAGLKVTFRCGSVDAFNSDVESCDETYQVSHETIYRSRFIQAHGVLKKRRVQYLRRKRVMRRSLVKPRVG